jgi:hypothetical protein
MLAPLRLKMAAGIGVSLGKGDFHYYPSLMPVILLG